MREFVFMQELNSFRWCFVLISFTRLFNANSHTVENCQIVDKIKVFIRSINLECRLVSASDAHSMCDFEKSKFKVKSNDRTLSHLLSKSDVLFLFLVDAIVTCALMRHD